MIYVGQGAPIKSTDIVDQRTLNMSVKAKPKDPA